MADMLVMRVTKRSAHMLLRIGRASLQTFDWGGVLYLPRVMDASDAKAFIGSPLERLLEHPATSRGESAIGAVIPEQ